MKTSVSHKTADTRTGPRSVSSLTGAYLSRGTRVAGKGSARARQRREPGHYLGPRRRFGSRYRLVADAPRAPDDVTVRGHDARAHEAAFRRRVGVIAPIPVMIRRAPVIRADADAERADVHTDAAGIGAQINLRAGGGYRTHKRERRRRKQNAFHI